MKNKLQLLIFFVLIINLAVGQQAILLQDIYPGENYGVESSFIGGKMAVNGNLFFRGRIPSGQRVFKTDGTSEGTVPVAENYDWQGLNNLTVADSGVYCSSAKDIYYYDSAVDSIRFIFNFDSLFLSHIRTIGHKAFFFLSEDYFEDPSQIWISEGTVSSTIKLGELETSDFDFSSHNDSLFVTAESSTNWEQFTPVISDGTPSGTSTLIDFFAHKNLLFNSIKGAYIKDNYIFLEAKMEGNNGNQGYVYNLVSNELHECNFRNKVKNVHKINNNYFIVTREYLTVWNEVDFTYKVLSTDVFFFGTSAVVGDYLLFNTRNDQNPEAGLTITDGTIEGTTTIDSNIGISYYDPVMTSYEDHLYYTKRVDGFYELWRCNPLNLMIDYVDNLGSHTGKTLVPYLGVVNNRLVFSKKTDDLGIELYYWGDFPINTELEESICEGDSFIVGSNFHESTGTYVDTLTASNGTDSIVLLYLEVIPTPEINLGEDQIITEDESLIISASISSGNVTWNNGDEGSWFYFIGALYGVGTHELSATVVDENGCSNTDSILITVEMASSIDDVAEKIPISVFPNPTSTHFQVKTAEGNPIKAIRIFNSKGKLITVENINSLVNHYSISTQSWEEGFYLIQCSTAEGIVYKKIVIH